MLYWRNKWIINDNNDDENLKAPYTYTLFIQHGDKNNKRRKTKHAKYTDAGRKSFLNTPHLNTGLKIYLSPPVLLLFRIPVSFGLNNLVII